MATKRYYAVRAFREPGVPELPEDRIVGGFSFSAGDAAKAYATIYLAGYDVLPPRFIRVVDTKSHGLHALWSAEAVNQTTRMGARISIKELNA